MIEALAACAAVLLVASGLAKLRRPAPAATMLRALTGRRTVPASVARLAGTIELAVGVLAIAVGGRAAFALLAVAYLVLALVAARLLSAGRGAGPRIACGCFGSSDAPIGSAHLVLDVVGSVTAALAAADGTSSFAGLGDRTVTHAVVAGLQIVLLSWLAYLAVTDLPTLAARRRELTGAARPDRVPSNGAP